ncbi:Uncharacterised protein [Mycobacteroides abscessus subsp. abscessus]|nr:Uncharacterised protein [Mycobacteroides abscessus subsp. abscessus]
MSLDSCLARDLPNPNPMPRPPDCIRLNAKNSTTSRITGSRYSSSDPRMLPWLTVVLTAAPLPLSFSSSGTPYPVGYLVMTLSLPSVSPLAAFRSSRSCCSRSSMRAFLTLSVSICLIATVVSTGL